MNIGILVGRFQTPELTTGQLKVLNDFLNENYDFKGIILGIPVTKASAYNPLDFDSRRRMIEESFPKKFQFGYVKDESDDFVWSNQLDYSIDLILKQNKIFSHRGEEFNIFIHGNKFDVISKYFGKYCTKEIENDYINSMEFQKEFVGKKVMDNASWRAGACWSANNRYPVAYHTVDCAIFDDLSFRYVWMGKKENENKLRFIGGFVDPNDDSAEFSAIREAEEETGLKCFVKDYISSRKIDDWRYRNEADKIITTFYALVRGDGTPKASDDIKEIYKVDVLNINEENIMPIHRGLLKDLKNWMIAKQKNK